MASATEESRFFVLINLNRIFFKVIFNSAVGKFVRMFEITQVVNPLFLQQVSGNLSKNQDIPMKS